ncbi:hypothetical protein [Arthrobacter sp. HY1533]|uniref:hypothetical protein n=1 Tax=Arthrobacter sp. HY1533 TaxID=2970919 RepID=UPI0022B9D5E2|nr:hypothetical protein [Arthrobacter sp. HY1533]
MASTISELFEGADGVNITSANTVFDLVEGTFGAKFSTAVSKAGTSSAKIVTTAGNCQMELTRTSVTTRYWSFYIRPTAAPSTNTVVFFVGSSLATANRTFQVTFNADLTMKVQQGSTATIVGAATTSTLPLNQWSRVDVSLVSGALSFALFPGDLNCDAAVGTAATGNKVSATITPTAITSLYLGAGNSSTNNFYLDAFREDDAAIPAPVAVADPDPEPGPDPAPKRLYAWVDPDGWVGLV